MGIESISDDGEEVIPFLKEEHANRIPKAADPNAETDDDDDEDEGEDDDDSSIGEKKSFLQSLILGPSRWQAKSPRTIIFLVAALKFCLAVGIDVLSLPFFRLMEDMYCHIYYQDDSLILMEEMKCKIDGVQSPLAYMRGWIDLTNSIVSMVATLLFGTLADKIGRKPTAMFSCFGIIVSFNFLPLMMGLLQRHVRRNPFLILAGSFLTLIGGGLHVLLAALYAIAADVSPDEQKASSFVYLTFGSTTGVLLGSLVGGILLQIHGPWVPIYIVLTVMPFSFIFFLFIPETLPLKAKAKAKSNSKTGRGHGLFKAAKAGVTQALRELGGSFALLKNPNIPLILIYFLFHNARMAAYGSMLTQYLSNNFGWKLAETGFLLSPLGFFNLVMLLAVPKASSILTSPRFGFSSFRKDLWLARLCAMVFIIGAVIEGFTSHIALFIMGILIQAIGTGNSPLARATLTHHVEPEQTSRLYALISVAEVAGSPIGAPVLAWCFSFGMGKGGMLKGLPWFYCAFFGGLVWLCLACVRPPRHLRRQDCEDGSQEMSILTERNEER